MKTPTDTKPSGSKLALSRAEAATALGISPITIDRLVKRRLFPLRYGGFVGAIARSIAR